MDVKVSKESFLLSSKGPLNRIFAGHSFEGFFLCFALSTYYVISLRRTEMVLPLTSRSGMSIRAILLRQLIKLAVIYVWLSFQIVWFFGDSVFDRILELTGGHCLQKAGLNYKQCRILNGKWIGGTKFSGHSLILSCFGLSLIFELENVSKTYRPDAATALLKGLLFCCSVYIAAWLLLFTITAIFYHTLPEKIVGLAAGMFVPYLLYFKLEDKLKIV
ncbi:hypothetical protein KL907_000409 [Ogataea polymorpha]|nr:hypothetical protein KL907_000409 [Ogataea polymorpha]